MGRRGSLPIICRRFGLGPGAQQLLNAANGVAVLAQQVVDLARKLDWPPRYTARVLRNAYIERWQPLDCVGSYRIEDPGIKLFERIEGEDFTGIIGLPLLAVARLLRGAGLLVG